MTVGGTIAVRLYRACLNAGRPISPVEMADLSGLTIGQVNSRTHQLTKDGVLKRVEYGKYVAGHFRGREEHSIPGHWIALQQLAHGPLTNDELAELLDVKPGHVKKTIFTRVRDGQIEFADGKYQITARGIARLEEEP